MPGARKRIPARWKHLVVALAVALVRPFWGGVPSAPKGYNPRKREMTPTLRTKLESAREQWIVRTAAKPSTLLDLPHLSWKRRTKLMKLVTLAALGIAGLMGAAATAAQAPSPWQQPAAALAGKIADLLGPGQAHLTLRNLSSIPASELAAIQNLLSHDLQARGVIAAGPESANSLRVTLSESATERLWVAEVIEGDNTQVAIIDAGPATQPQPQAAGPLTLRRMPILLSNIPVLAALEMPSSLVFLEPEEIAIYPHISTAGWSHPQTFPVVQSKLSRDPRGILRPSADGQGFEAWLPGAYCSGAFSIAPPPGTWTVNCHASDDPWVIDSGSTSPVAAAPSAVAPALPALLPYPQANAPASAAPAMPTIKAFYNAARNYFTGTIVPNPSVDIPPFYSAALIPRAAGGEALLIGAIDGKVKLLENGALMPVDGTRDWGSDFAALHSGCATGTEIVASSSGQALNDSLRSYDLPAHEATPASAPISMAGAVTALWTAPDGKSVVAVVRTDANQYEVDRVSATCN
jgi:hypothetical protein